MPAVSESDTIVARKRLRTGRSPGLDGIPSDVLRRSGTVIQVMTRLFSVMFRFAVYPSSLGVAIIRSLLKPNKPKNLASSLRGIKLLNSIAAWFGQVLDRPLCNLCQAGNEQFGFRAGTGCAEAVAVLMALILSRTMRKKRLFVLWVDVRTAFPSLNRS